MNGIHFLDSLYTAECYYWSHPGPSDSEKCEKVYTLNIALCNYWSCWLIVTNNWELRHIFPYLLFHILYSVAKKKVFIYITLTFCCSLITVNVCSHLLQLNVLESCLVLYSFCRWMWSHSYNDVFCVLNNLLGTIWFLWSIPIPCCEYWFRSEHTCCTFEGWLPTSEWNKVIY